MVRLNNQQPPSNVISEQEIEDSVNEDPIPPDFRELSNSDSLNANQNTCEESKSRDDESDNYSVQSVLQDAEDHGVRMIPRLIRYMSERAKNRERWVTPLEKKVVPIRLINGVEDPISGAHAAKRFEEVVPNADVIRIEHSGHYPHLETPEAVIQAFLDFHDDLKS